MCLFIRLLCSLSLLLFIALLFTAFVCLLLFLFFEQCNSFERFNANIFFSEYFHCKEVPITRLPTERPTGTTEEPTTPPVCDQDCAGMFCYWFYFVSVWDIGGGNGSVESDGGDDDDDDDDDDGDDNGDDGDDDSDDDGCGSDDDGNDSSNEVMVMIVIVV